MGQISVLAHDEAVQLDSDQLGLLYGQLGESQADEVITKALEDLANRLSVIERSYYNTDFETLSKTAKGLIAVADQMGLPGLAQVSQSVCDLAAANDAPALSAALARLVRLGDRSLSAVWEVQDLHGAI